MNDETTSNEEIDQSYQKISELRKTIGEILIGQEKVVDQILIALLANGHVLLEGVPGLGKTLLAKTLAACISGEFKRIQFTPDLMPADITGHTLFNMKEGEFSVRKGPVFTNFLLADEINRSPAKTQAALLEVMQEKQVTIEGEPQKIPKPFMVMATQNPIEQEGTYPLPEAELDRFLMKVFIDFPEYDDEVLLTKIICADKFDDTLTSRKLSAICDTQYIQDVQQSLTRIIVDDELIKYAVRLVRATRQSPAIIQGASPRACIGIIRCSRAYALLNERDFVLPDDIKSVAMPVMRHRISLSADVEIDGLTADDILANILDSVEAPRI
ncbi:MAG: MoxR family ATPase [Gammaproteobacteria bacterium]|nr:MoxR family ATPase [Gammaproteobacteria bacterium]